MMTVMATMFNRSIDRLCVSPLSSNNDNDNNIGDGPARTPSVNCVSPLSTIITMIMITIIITI